MGNSWWRKMFWLSMYWAVQALLRPTTVKAIGIVDRWVVINAVAMVAAMAPIVWYFGWWPLAYLFLSTRFSLGVHPVGARWVQEQFVFREEQETYSYYGPEVVYNRPRRASLCPGVARPEGDPAHT